MERSGFESVLDADVPGLEDGQGDGHDPGHLTPKAVTYFFGV